MRIAAALLTLMLLSAPLVGQAPQIQLSDVDPSPLIAASTETPPQLPASAGTDAAAQRLEYITAL